MTRFARGVLFPLACAVAFVGLTGGSAHAQVFLPQPYLVYEVPPEPIQPVPLVDLQDQFIRESEVAVLERWLFMNPVAKTPIEPQGQPEPITDGALHYRWHRIDLANPGTTRSVALTNQFGTEVPWTIEAAPRVLLAPASKVFPPELPGPEPPGQHYDCYEAVEAPDPAALVGLEDQFGDHGATEVMLGRYLCVPAVKTKDQQVFPTFEAEDGRDHLACYEIQPHNHDLFVNTRNQFTGVDPDLTHIIADQLLCVPTIKRRLDFDPQPYLVYEVPPELIAPTVVDLEDQFIREQDVPVLDRWFLMNPVLKTPIEPPNQNEPITDPDLHYRWHSIQVDQPGTRKVKVTNQFGDQMPWTISGAPVFLLAPASKALVPTDPGPEPPGTHYDCYDALEAPPADALVALQDQFGTHPDSPVTLARFLCAPTVKTKPDGMGFPVLAATDGRDHLACYEVPPHPHQEDVNTRTQFTAVGPDATSVEHDLFLCVPSIKTVVPTPQLPSLAPWGIATLGVLMLLTVLGMARRRAR